MILRVLLTKSLLFKARDLLESFLFILAGFDLNLLLQIDFDFRNFWSCGLHWNLLQLFFGGLPGLKAASVSRGAPVLSPTVEERNLINIREVACYGFNLGSDTPMLVESSRLV